MSLAVVRRFISKVEADLAADLLVEHGIQATVFADDAGGMYPVLQQHEGVGVLVPEDSVPEATRVLEAQYGPSRVSRPPLSTRQRVQSVLGLTAFALFVVGLVLFAAANMPSAR